MSIHAQLESIEAAYDDQQATIENLRARLNAVANGAPAKKAEKAPLREFPSVGALVEFVAENGWERASHTTTGGASFMLKVVAGRRLDPKTHAYVGVDTRPYVQYIVDGMRVYRWSYSTQTPDWVQIAQRRVIDVAGHVGKSGQRYCIAMAQEGDDASEEDWADMVELVRNYSGGLNRPLSSWDRHEAGKKLKAVYLETHEDPGTEYTQRNPNTLGYSYGNW